jgi:hypothetical protein
VRSLKFYNLKKEYEVQWLLKGTKQAFINATMKHGYYLSPGPFDQSMSANFLYPLPPFNVICLVAQE